MKVGCSVASDDDVPFRFILALPRVNFPRCAA